MRFILNGINGQYLQNILANSVQKTESVLAAVAYSTKPELLFDWCSKNNIPLKYYGRLDAGVAVNVPTLQRFLNKKSPDYVCKLVKHHHAKVIWWRGAGIYIGSANLTDSAWHKNVEAGCFFEEEEITDEMANDILVLFKTLDENAEPLTNELLAKMVERAKILSRFPPDDPDFWKTGISKMWGGLVHTAPKKAHDRNREAFLTEWNETLQYLRNIGDKVSQENNRPSWINSSVPTGAQADQFLDAYYYGHAFESRRAIYERLFEKNKSRTTEALIEMIEWWKNIPEAPTDKYKMLNETVPFLQSALSKKNLHKMDKSTFHKICMSVHSIKDYARRVPNKMVDLATDTGKYEIKEKVDALANCIWNDQSSKGERVKGLFKYILYDGSDGELPERLWQGVTDSTIKIDFLGISSLGEVVGWALPDDFPPRNGRTSKALRSLGYDVNVHVR